MAELKDTAYWYLKNSRNQYICEGNRLKQNSFKAIMFYTKVDALQYRRINRRRSFHLEEVIHINYIDDSNYPKTVMTFEEKTILHRQSDED